ncbi:MAG: hypothetical protein KIS87_03905 [Phycisphaeraceae bacterium]|nr:hypothetical protein [Phycisphaeraceae bacterium]
MSRWERRSFFAHANANAATHANARRVRARAGRPLGARADAAPLEHLENRMLLDGVPGLPHFDDAPLLTLDGSGNATFDEAIDFEGDDDLYRLDVTTTDFITVLADAAKGAGQSQAEFNARVDTRLEIYDRNHALIFTASNSGALSAGTPTEAWVGFVPTTGHFDPQTSVATYFIRVLSDRASGANSTGDYTLRVSTLSTLITPSPSEGSTNSAGTLTRQLEDRVFRLQTGSGSAYDSLVTAVAASADFTQLDTRLDVYSSTGQFITGDSQTAFLTDAYSFFKGNPSSTYYLRVRSDEFAPGRPWAGDYTLVVDASATSLPLDPVRRYGFASALVNLGGINAHRFVSLGTGRTIISAEGSGILPVNDPTMRLYGPNGNLIAISTDFFGDSPQLDVDLIGGQTYFVSIDAFIAGGAIYTIQVESPHTVNLGGIDDHADAGDFANATPIVWNWLGDTTPTAANTPGMFNPMIPGWTYAPVDDHAQVFTGHATGRLHDEPDTDLFSFVPPVDMLGTFAGRADSRSADDGGTDNRIWWAGYRPSTRVEIQVVMYPADQIDPLEPPFDFLNAQIRVIDSVGNVVYPTGGAFNDWIFNPAYRGNEPAGMIDPARYPRQFIPGMPWLDVPSFNGAVFGFDAWGGETYYLEISGTGTGRYSAQVIVDASFDPSDPANIVDPQQWTIGEGSFNDLPFSRIKEFLNAGQWTAATEVALNPITGDGTTPLGSGPNGYFDRSTHYERAYSINTANIPQGPPPPSFLADPTVVGHGIGILQESGGAGIMHPLDTDLYFFTAPRSGFAEVRVNTTGLNDTFSEIEVDWDERPDQDKADDPTLRTATKTKTYNSLLQSGLRIFNRDLEQIVYNNRNPAMVGVTSNEFIGSLGSFTFHERDARVTFPIVQGEVYYIQVESGQRDNYLAWIDDPTLPVQWQHLIGSYDILVHTVAAPSLSALDEGDDVVDGDVNGVAVPVNTEFSTVLAIDDLGQSAFQGRIAHTTNNPFDTDLFTFISPVNGTATIRVNRAAGSSLIPDVIVFRQEGAQVNAVTFGTAASDGLLTLTVSAQKGERFYIYVAGAGGTQGLYDLSLSGLAFVDDHATWLDIQNATQIDVFDFLGSGSVTGRIEGSGNSDVFKVRSSDFAVFTATVTSLTQGFNPRLDVYETSVDPAGHTILLRIGSNDDISPTDTNARVAFAVNGDRVSSYTGLEYPWYYLLVRGSNANTDNGDYRLDITFPPTDDHADEGQFSLATPVGIDSGTGEGAATGVVEVIGDTDLFRFTAPASGLARITVSRPGGSSFLPMVSLLDVAGNDVVPPVDGVIPAAIQGQVVRGQTYFVLVQASTIAAGAQRTGAYTVNFLVPPIDDHPNANEWFLATNVPLDHTTGDGIVGTMTPGHFSNPTIAPLGDSDLFTFLTIADGVVAITVTPLDTTLIAMTAKLTIFDSEFNVVTSDVSVNPVIGTGPGEAVSVVLTNTFINQRYYVLVQANLDNRTGEYHLLIDGPPGDGSGGGGDPDFDASVLINLSSEDGNGSASGVISRPGERDLFTFTTLGVGRVYVQVVTPTGSLLDASVTILNAPSFQAVHAFDAAGIPGATANLSYDVAGAGQQFWIVVTGLGNGVGSYTLRLDTPPAVFKLYYPEGFTGSTIREFVSLNNPNPFPVTYSVTLRYETGDRDQVIVQNETIAAGSRGGVTISDAANGSPVGARSEPYSVIVESIGGPLAATMARYDFNSAVGDAFTNRISTIWTFGRVERVPGSIFDFIVFYNPFDFDVHVTFSAHDPNGNEVSFTTTVNGLRRGGWNINEVLSLPTGVFGARVTAAAADPANAPAFRGIVAAISHYDSPGMAGFGALGDYTGGGTIGAVPGLTNGNGSSAELVLYNPNPVPASITVRGRYTRVALPDVVRTVEIPARGTLVLAQGDLGFAVGQPVGVRYTSNVPVTAFGSVHQFGEGHDVRGTSLAATGWFFGDAFINTVLAGESYFETLTLYNPTPISTNISIRLLFLDGTDDTLIVPVAARAFTEVRLHEVLGSAFEPNANRPAHFDPFSVLGRPGLNFFSISATAPIPVIVGFSHYDLFLRGGWGTGGAPFGLTNAVPTLG